MGLPDCLLPDQALILAQIDLHHIIENLFKPAFQHPLPGQIRMWLDSSYSFTTLKDSFTCPYQVGADPSFIATRMAVASFEEGL